MPLVNYAESPNEPENSANDGNYPKPTEHRTCMHKLALLDSLLQKDKVSRLLDSSDSNLADVVSKVVAQIDTSKM